MLKHKFNFISIFVSESSLILLTHPLMTEKQGKILQSALKLFAEKGYYSTSTREIAENADVSEALIFRHFSNKEGLLEAVLKDGEDKAKKIYMDVIMETNPRELIRKTLEMNFNIPETEFDFWRLQFKLKWELEVDTYEKMKPLRIALENAFKELGDENPELETDYIIHLLDGMAGAAVRGALPNKEGMRKLLLRKYGFE